MITSILPSLQNTINYDIPSLHSIFHYFFKRNTNPQNNSLQNTRWTVGGVENVGNTCFINVVLQELANFPEVYDADLFKKSDNDNNSELQNLLKKILKDIRTGNPTKANSIIHLRSLLKQKGWTEPPCSRIKQILNKIFPHIFPPPFQSPFKLHHFILKCFDSDTSSIILIDDNPKNLAEKLYSVDKRLKEINLPRENTKTSLCRIMLPLDHDYDFSDTIETNTHRFILEQVQYSPTKNHIATARKTDNNWLHINDDKVFSNKRPPNHQAVLLIYKAIEKKNKI